MTHAVAGFVYSAVKDGSIITLGIADLSKMPRLIRRIDIGAGN
jgi:hypothetical protein